MAANTINSSASKRPFSVSLRVSQNIRENVTGYLFIFPAVLIIGVFGLLPILYSMYMSTINWRAVKGDFVAFANYEKALGSLPGLLIFLAGLALMASAYFAWKYARRVFQNRAILAGGLAALMVIAGGWGMSAGWAQMLATGDPRFLNSLPITLFYSIGTVPIQLFLGLVIAYILFQNIRGREVYRMLYFLPYITPAIATAVVFRYIFSARDTSLANLVLSWLNLPDAKWLFEPNSFLNIVTGSHVTGFWAGPSLALVTVMLFGIWSFVGYDVVIFLAGLGGIPKEVYEAAEIDGATSAQMFRFVTIPMISPVTFYLALVAFIGTFKAFNHIFVMRTPNALNTVDVASVAIFDTFYKINNYGYAAAQAVMLFLIIAGLTYLQNKIFSDRVFYG